MNLMKKIKQFFLELYDSEAINNISSTNKYLRYEYSIM